jgi:flagellar hook-associated protein 2
MATSPLASAGIGSGLDVNAIIEKLMSVERRPLDALEKQQATFQSKISAYGVLKGTLSALQTAINGLTGTSAFRTMAATLSDTALASVATGTGATAGSHSVEVTALAQAHRVESSGFVSTADTVGSGTLTFTFGTWSAGTFTANGSAPTGTVTIGTNQSSLAGIRDAVNAAKIGVTATIVDDGSPAGKRLVFASSSGAEMSMKITVADADGNALDAAGLSQLAYDPAGTPGAGRNMEQKVAAQSASVIIDGITVVKPTNVIADAIEGVTLTLSKTNVGAPATLNVAANAEGAQKAMDAFVKSYNDVLATIAAVTRYNAGTQTASVLTGDAAVRGIQSKLRSIVGGSVAGAAATPGDLTTLAQVGVKTTADGTITLDAAKFGALLASDPAGVERLFSALGQASDSLVKYAGATDKTKVGDYAVTVTQLATRATLVGSAAAGLTITAGVNDTLTATIDNVTTTVTLAAGTYADASALAAEVASRINGTAAMRSAARNISIAAAGGVLTATSSSWGSSSAVSLSGSAAATLVGGAPVATGGLDAAGTIDGVVAIGIGRTLTAASGTPSEGLKLTIEGGALGARGTVRYSQGIAAQFAATLTDLLDSDGLVAAKTEGVQETIKQLDKRKDALEARLERVEAAYRRQYTALDANISRMSAISTYLAQQLANLPKPYDDGGNR